MIKNNVYVFIANVCMIFFLAPLTGIIFNDDILGPVGMTIWIAIWSCLAIYALAFFVPGEPQENWVKNLFSISVWVIIMLTIWMSGSDAAMILSMPYSYPLLINSDAEWLIVASVIAAYIPLFLRLEKGDGKVFKRSLIAVTLFSLLPMMHYIARIVLKHYFNH